MITFYFCSNHSIYLFSLNTVRYIQKRCTDFIKNQWAVAKYLGVVPGKPYTVRISFTAGHQPLRPPIYKRRIPMIFESSGYFSWKVLRKIFKLFLALIFIPFGYKNLNSSKYFYNFPLKRIKSSRKNLDIFI